MAFDYVKPQSMQGLLNDLAQVKSKGAVLAGGTDLLLKIRSGLITRNVLFDVNELQEMKGIFEEGDRLRLGAATRVNEVANSGIIKNSAAILCSAAGQLGSPLVRNRATLGGNIAQASPAADMIPPLLAMGARLRLKSRDSEREIDLEDFLKGPGQTSMGDNEVMTDVIVPRLNEDCRSRFIKVGRRKALAVSVVNLAGWVKTDQGHHIEDVRIVFGAVAPTALRMRKTEAFLKGKQPDTGVLQEAAGMAADETRPISDIRGTEQDRRLLVQAWTMHLLQGLLKES